MIELVYDKYDKDETTDDRKSQTTIKLPKNIRQVGQPSGTRKIYIEDYVVTYLNRLAKPSNTYSRGAILLGEYKKGEQGEFLFISGALEAQNLELDLDETVFTNDTWSDIYEKARIHFPELSVVGWFLSRLGFSTCINDKILKTHLDNFPGRDKTLYIIDALEGDDVFYLYENNGLRRQLGYYIYYTKNEAMQNYMIGRDVELENDEVDKKDEELLTTYHQMLDKGKEKTPSKQPSMLYVASTILTVAVLALGVTVLNSYDRMKSLEVSLNRVELAVSEQEPEGQSVKNQQNRQTNVVEVHANVTTEEVMQEQTQAVQETDVTAEPETEQTVQTEATTQSTTTQSTTTQEPEISVVMNDQTPVYYTVQEGDTISSISMKMYQSSKYVEEIVSANALENEDSIYIGQKILIPTLD